MLIMNTVLGTDDLDPKLEIWANFVPALKFAMMVMKFYTHNKWNMLIVNTHYGLERSPDYWLRMIVGCKFDSHSEHD